jgi:hypothetical protein
MFYYIVNQGKTCSLYKSPKFKNGDEVPQTPDQTNSFREKAGKSEWHDRFSDRIMTLGFFPCKSVPDIWIQRNGDTYEYVAIYDDDLAIAMKDPKEFINMAHFFRDNENTLCISPSKFIEKLVKTYEQMFGESPRQIVISLLEKGDNPELDTSIPKALKFINL